MITPSEVTVLDINAEYYGVPNKNLMEHAGKGVADFIYKNYKNTIETILLLCGTGNNGGDGLVAARYLNTHFHTAVFLTGEQPKTTLAQENYDKLSKLSLPIHKDINQLQKLLSQADLIVDALLGSGLKGELREPIKTIVQKINETKEKHIIAVDIPTGIQTSNRTHPQHTVTFHDIKEGMNKQNCGQIHTVDIGIPKQAQTHIGPGELTVYYPRFQKHSHKGDNGTVGIIGGGPYVGAPALAGLAALRTGADLVHIFTPQRCWNIIAGYMPDFIVTDLSSDYLIKEDLALMKPYLTRCNAVVIGPGLGAQKKTQDAIIPIIMYLLQENKPLVIDADAIKAVSSHHTLLKNTMTVITPHAGEFKQLTGETLPKKLAVQINTIQQWAKKLNVSLFVKGPVDILSDGTKTKLNNIHNEAMTVGGTGDVLSGIIGCLLAKNITSYNAMRMAAFLNGQAGNQAFEKKSYGLIASDVVNEIPTVLRNYL